MNPRLIVGNRTIALALTLLLPAIAGAEEALFHERSEEGWFWYQDPEPEPDEKEPEAPAPAPAPASVPSPAPTPSGPPPGSVAWLREAMPAALDYATDHPTYENVERYFLLQHQAANKAELFSDMAETVTTGHPVLDEGRRRPQGDRFAKILEEEANERATLVAQNLFKTSGLVLFFDRQCSGCALLATNLSRMEALYGLSWYAVSLDGSIFPASFEVPTVFDQGISVELGVSKGGALFIATPPDRFDPVSWTATAGSEIVDRVLRVAFRAGLITEEQFRLTQPINPMSTDTLSVPSQDVPDILTQADQILRSNGLQIPSE